jgi:hypothetical protein
MCEWCGQEPAVSLTFSRKAVENGDEDLNGCGIGWYETQELIIGYVSLDDRVDEVTIDDYCSRDCIHLAGEFKHGMAESD